MSSQTQQLIQAKTVVLKVAGKRGTFGFAKWRDGGNPHPAIVEHVFADGRILVHPFANKGYHVILDPEEFEPSRDAYFSEGSWVEPEWDGDSARCRNCWEEPEHNLGINVMTDEEAANLAEPQVTLLERTIVVPQPPGHQCRPYSDKQHQFRVVINLV